MRRHRSDSVVNHRLVTVVRAGGEVQARWQELRIGDVVKVWLFINSCHTQASQTHIAHPQFCVAVVWLICCWRAGGNAAPEYKLRMLQVVKETDVPADILFLAGSDKASNTAFVETASLDGETNLKQKECCQGSKAACTAAELGDFSRTSYVKCERPNER